VLNAFDGDPIITKIMHFEFAGFFPREAEFTNTLIRYASDWSKHAHDVFLTTLRKRNIATPAGAPFLSQFDQACVLVEMIENVGPWWPRNGGKEGKLQKTT